MSIMNSESDIHFMSLAIDLAEKGRGLVSPNPMVGAVVVRDGEIVGKGYHKKAGGNHAEVIAIQEAGDRAKGATIYVNMEPCCHFGKTPPCTETIIKSGISRVVSSMKDINPLVNGCGFETLNQNKIETIVGILKERAQKLNEAYIKFIQYKIPFVTLKLAMTLDSKIAAPDGKSKWITGPEARKRVHMLRAESDAVMVGIGTLLADNPMLTVRDSEGSNPLRVIVDSKLRIPEDANVFRDDNKEPQNNVVLATTQNADKNKLARLTSLGVKVWEFESDDGLVPIPKLLEELGKNDITSLLCEGGSILASSLLKEKLVDKIIFNVAPKLLGCGFDAVKNFGIDNLDTALCLKNNHVETLGDDILITGYPEYN
ncbi:bifunctional diaminohydroxyphosphoribosylaminopyrimidine deaminase/5-amino-6-(5-phosphoribosylamino)uracil reductase RibD [Candidatus Latescibacterota bacterium]